MIARNSSEAFFAGCSSSESVLARYFELIVDGSMLCVVSLTLLLARQGPRPQGQGGRAYAVLLYALLGSCAFLHLAVQLAKALFAATVLLSASFELGASPYVYTTHSDPTPPRHAP